MNPYEARVECIPPTDRYANDPLYGRYHPRPDDFKPDAEHILSTTEKSLEYWTSILEKCDTSTRLYENDEDSRDVFALGSVIIKSSHLKHIVTSSEEPPRDYTFADENEVRAIALARTRLGDIRAPQIYFAGKIKGRQTLVQERIPGVALTVAWPYLTAAQKLSFKQQIRQALDLLFRSVHNSTSCSESESQKAPSYVFPDDDPVVHKRIQTLERELLFGNQDSNDPLGFVHNDLTDSNIIVDQDRIVGIIDWEMAGFFRWSATKEVHERIRGLRREMFEHLNLPKERIDDMVYWNSLYAEEE